ncbi:methyltransferase family protein [Tistlia consotensis]|nr:isoprenylcysteine carboxylmethyltransferase family protein [Tistlia consotensis]
MLFVLVTLGVAQVYLECTTERRQRYLEGGIRSLQYLLGIPALLNLGLFLADPDLWAGGYLSVSRPLAVAGVVIFNAAALTILWAHLSLRRFRSAELETRADHRLVETGPYRWIRHPLYSSYLLITAGLFLMTGNWLVTAPMFAYFLAIAARAWKEEAMLLERLGGSYREYMARTERFLPRPAGALRAGASYLRQAFPD